MGSGFKNISIGTRFGKWTVLARAKNYQSSKSRKTFATWLCRCDCGRERTVIGNSLRMGGSKQCGSCRRAFKDSTLAGLNRAFYDYKYRAKKTNREFTISKEEFKTITRQDCFYCGGGPANISANSRSNGKYIYNGIDRLDNDKGYVIGNVLPCCDRHNTAKGSASTTVILRAAAMLILKLFPASDKA